MKISYVLIVLSVLYASNTYAQVIFSGAVYNSPSQKVYLATLRGKVDSTEINAVRPNFTLKANINKETFFQIYYAKKGPFVLNQFIALPGEHIEFTYDLDYQYNIHDPTGKNLWITVTGSPLTTERITAFKKTWAFKRDEEKVQKEIDSIREYNTSDTSEIAFKKEEIKVDEVTSNLIYRKLLDTTGSPMNADLMLSGLAHSYLTSSATMDSLTLVIKDRFPDVPYIQSINNDSFSDDQGLALHSIAPDINLKDINGNSVNLKTIKHKYLLIDFWASWCKPCREENPNLKKALIAFKDKGFRIASISIDSKIEKWKAAVTKDGTEAFTQLIDETAANSIYLRQFKIKSIPANFLIDNDGNIVAKNLRDDELFKELEKLLGK